MNDIDLAAPRAVHHHGCYALIRCLHPGCGEHRCDCAADLVNAHMDELSRLLEQARRFAVELEQENARLEAENTALAEHVRFQAEGHLRYVESVKTRHTP
jgi:hypothetical protein